MDIVLSKKWCGRGWTWSKFTLTFSLTVQSKLVLSLFYQNFGQCKLQEQFVVREVLYPWGFGLRKDQDPNIFKTRFRILVNSCLSVYHSCTVFGGDATQLQKVWAGRGAGETPLCAWASKGKVHGFICCCCSPPGADMAFPRGTPLTSPDRATRPGTQKSAPKAVNLQLFMYVTTYALMKLICLWSFSFKLTHYSLRCVVFNYQFCTRLNSNLIFMMNNIVDTVDCKTKSCRKLARN